MMEEFSIVYLAAHGETAWTLKGQYNGMTDLPLTEQGERDARALKRGLHGLTFAKIFTSPLQRAFRTCDLAGFATVSEIDSDLREWDFGAYEGWTDAEIRVESPDWYLFHDGCPHGESPEQITVRADALIARLRRIDDDVLLFSSNHFIRALAVRWIGLRLSINARRFALNIASLSAVGYENSLSLPVIRLWNDTRHVSRPPVQQRAATT